MGGATRAIERYVVINYFGRRLVETLSLTLENRGDEWYYIALCSQQQVVFGRLTTRAMVWRARPEVVELLYTS